MKIILTMAIVSILLNWLIVPIYFKEKPSKEGFFIGLACSLVILLIELVSELVKCSIPPPPF